VGSGTSLAVQLFLIVPRTLILFALFAAITRVASHYTSPLPIHLPISPPVPEPLMSHLPLRLCCWQVHEALYYPGRGVFFIASALVLFLYSFTVLLLDCQQLQTAAWTFPPPPFHDAQHDVRLFGVSLFGHPWLGGPPDGSRPRGLSDVEIERVGALTTFRGAELRGPVASGVEAKEEETAPLEPGSGGRLEEIEKGEGRREEAGEERPAPAIGAGREDVPQVSGVVHLDRDCCDAQARLDADMGCVCVSV
jgi:hypothetical protein